MLLVVVIIGLTCSQSMCVRAEIDEGCPPWYTPDGDGECTFVHQLPQIVRQYGNSSELEMGFCMTVTNTSIVVAQCPYIPVGHNIRHLYHNIYRVLPSHLDEVNSSLCALYNRRGFLCSQCKEGHGLAAYRYYGLMCVQCSHNTALMLIAYLALLFVPPTIFFFSFLLLKINVHSGNLNGFIHFSQLVMSTVFFFPQVLALLQSQFGYWPVQIFLSLYGVWSLNFLQFLIPPFCVSPHLTTLQLISLGYVPSAYSLLLCIATNTLIDQHARGNWCLVKIWSPVQKLIRKKFKVHSIQEFSLVKTFAAFMFLSYGSNLFVSFCLVQGSVLMELNLNTGEVRSLLPHSVDLQAPFFGSTHTPYAVLGIMGGLLTVILPLVLVLVFPTRVFPKLIQCCGLRRWHALRTFMEVFAGSFKDGTEQNNKRDCRIFVGGYLIGRIVHGVMWHANGAIVQSYSWPLAAVIFLLTATIVAFFQPHRKVYHNAIDVLLLLLTGAMCIWLHVLFGTTINKHSLYRVTLILLISAGAPHVILIIYFSYKLVSWAVSQGHQSSWVAAATGQGYERITDDNVQETQPLLAQCTSLHME